MLEAKKRYIVTDENDEILARKPEWLKVRRPMGKEYEDVLSLVKEKKLHTVCQSARCPNIGECWANSTATFLILGNECTRGCAFCAITAGDPKGVVDMGEPERVAQAVNYLKLKFAVITSVTRDDLKDGGAEIFARTTVAIKEQNPGCGVELLVPDFLGDKDAIATVVHAKPDVLNHNIETVPRLYPLIRHGADYARSLELLKYAKELDSSIITKSGIMVGLGEEKEEIVCTLRDLRAHNVETLTIGQYLRPSKNHYPVKRYLEVDEFEELESCAKDLGFTHVESSPLVRSSYHAERGVVTEKLCK